RVSRESWFLWFVRGHGPGESNVLGLRVSAAEQIPHHRFLAKLGREVRDGVSRGDIFETQENRKTRPKILPLITLFALIGKSHALEKPAGAKAREFLPDLSRPSITQQANTGLAGGPG